MARIRGIGELTYSPFHSLPYQANEPAYFQLLIDDSIWSIGNELQHRFPAPWKDDEIVVWGENVWDWLLHHSLTELSWKHIVLFDNECMRLTNSGGDCHKFMNIGQIAGFVQQYGQGLRDSLPVLDWHGIIACLVVIAHMPSRLVSALFILSKKLSVGVESLDADWDFSVELEERTFLVSIVPDRPVENTDKFLQSFARKLNQALRATTN